MDIAILFLLAMDSAWAIDPGKHLSQYTHTAWRTQDGDFRGVPHGIQQTSDGYLWIGTDSGLLRFDGVRFVPWIAEGKEKLPTLQITNIRAARDGSLWIGTATGISRWKNNHLTNYLSVHEPILNIFEDEKGGTWFLRWAPPDGSKALCQVLDLDVRCYGQADAVPALILPVAFVEDAQGDFWIGSDTSLLRWKPGSSTVYQPKALKTNVGQSGIVALLPNRDGTVLIGIDKSGQGLGLQRLVQGKLKPYVTSGLDGSTLDVTALLRDRENALWVATQTHGIYRIYGDRVEHFGSAQGLSGDFAWFLLEDHEGNLWVCTTKGIDRFSDTRVVTISNREGLGSDEVDGVIASRDGGIWIGEAGSLDRLRGGNVSSIHTGKGLPGSQVRSMLEDHAGRLWLGVDNFLSIYQNDTFKTIKRADGSPIGTVVGLAEDAYGSVWVETSTPRRMLTRVQDLAVREEFPAPQVPAALRIAADPKGGLWLGLLSGDLAHYQNGKVETYQFAHNEGAWVNQLIPNADGSMLGATTYGVIGVQSGNAVSLTVQNGLPCEVVHGMTFDSLGNLWLYTECALVEVTGTELQKWWKNPHLKVTSRSFDVFDGVQPHRVSFEPAARSTDGRLWFANGQALQMIDPTRLDDNPLPPPVHIEQLVADQKTFVPDNTLRLPPLTHNLEIEYTALSFVAPQKVRFRYKLEGVDSGWVEPGTRRQAFYTDLRPRNYRFHVVACNNIGIWNEDGATLDFAVAPAWFQTNWFRFVFIAGICLAVWAIYRLRLEQIAAAMSARFDERLAERTRIARDLHDTLLQTIQGSRLVANNALAPNTDPAEMSRAMKQLSAWLGRASQEGRAALNSLRTSTTQTNDLAEGFQRAVDECRLYGPMEASFGVTGETRDMHPVVRDEVFRVGYEAIRNACVHSHGSRIKVELTYGHNLTVRVTDNGVGIDSAVLAQGRGGHFGLQGMRERVTRIGAKLTIVSSAGSGTQITVVVPGSIVFRQFGVSRFRKLWARLRRTT
jgi:signal transduction histidine kinase/ligand-binding sensor domain-containing protein